jgi:subtilisin-like proprotein convertase family protein
MIIPQKIMLRTNFQKMGGVVASLVSILAFSSSAEALTFSSPTAVYSIPDNNATGVTASIDISGQGNITNFNSVTISGLTHTWYSDLRAFLSNGSTTVQLFRTQWSPDSQAFTQGSADLNGNYTFATTGANWYTQTNPVPSNITYQSWQPLSAFNGSSLNGTWTLNVQDRLGGDTGSFTGFSINVDAEPVPVPFEFSHQSILVIFAGSWLVLRKLKKKSAQKVLNKVG